MNPAAWCQYCEKAIPELVEHDCAMCNTCGKFFCESLGDLMLGLCGDCIAKLKRKQ